MKTPRNITDLKTEVRAWLTKNPHKRQVVRDLADIDDDPDLFGWIRLWIEVKMQEGNSIDGVIYAITHGSHK